MALYVADTHAPLWYLGGSQVLGDAAKAAFEEVANGSGQVLIPAIVIAELISLSEKRGREIDVNRIVDTLRSQPGFRLTDLSPEIVLGILPIVNLRDIHDRLIVSEAIAQGATLITRDQSITDSGLTPVVW